MILILKIVVYILADTVELEYILTEFKVSASIHLYSEEQLM